LKASLREDEPRHGAVTAIARELIAFLAYDVPDQVVIVPGYHRQIILTSPIPGIMMLS
jgi:hypothetical protein